MRRSLTTPDVHLFVCTNRRAATDPLAAVSPGCGESGTQLYFELKKQAAAEGRAATVWITQTGCLGLCPKTGATVAIYSRQAIAQEILIEVASSDARTLYDEATRVR